MNENGLTSKQAKELLLQNGLNELTTNQNNIVKKIKEKLFSPISLMLITASVLSYFTDKAFDTVFILILLLINVLVSLIQELKADNAVKKLNKHLETYVKTLRDGKWIKINSKYIVSGDIVKLVIGQIAPTDGKVIKRHNVSINEAELTGESLPVFKNTNDNIYSGSHIVTGTCIYKVTETGKDTYFGKTISKVNRDREHSLLEKDILSISKYLSALSIIAVVILSIYFSIHKTPLLQILTLDLSLVIAGIPISLPTVTTLIIEFGVIDLAKKNVIVRKLSALNDLSNVNFLLTDKTGTLTKNEIEVDTTIKYSVIDDVLINKLVKTIVNENSDDPINNALLKYTKDININDVLVSSITPADSDRKRSTALIEYKDKTYLVSLGAPQIIKDLCDLSEIQKEKYYSDIESFAKNGYRSVALAIKDNGTNEFGMKLTCMYALADTLREDAKEIIGFLKQNGIHTVMITGDNRSISEEIAKKLAIGDGVVLSNDDLKKIGINNLSKQEILTTGAFAEVLPEDKLNIVKKAKEYFITVVTGDGVNDLPPIKTANVGIAVSNAVDALKESADIVLLTNGLSVIKDAIINSRKIFSRLYYYSTYRISESLRLIITIAILGILFKEYPLTPIQLILLALLNDIPIISLATDRVKSTASPSNINVRERLIKSTFYGIVGVLNSLILFFIMDRVLYFDWLTIQTVYFLKLTVSGHLLIYVAHTKERWFKYLPSWQVILATLTTQLIASILAYTGILMPTNISLSLILFVWIWSFLWMQVAELSKSR